MLIPDLITTYQGANMNIKLQNTILRNSNVRQLFNICKSTVNNRVRDGLLPPPISLGARAVGWVQLECETVLAAMIAGKSPEEIKLIVNKLVTKRNSDFQTIRNH